MKYSLFFLFAVTFVLIDNATCKECTQASCDKECQDQGRENGICALTAQGDICQCSTQNKECVQAACDKECQDKGRESGICGVTANGDICTCKHNLIGGVPPECYSAWVNTVNDDLKEP